MGMKFSWIILLLVAIFLACANSLYEDQIKKFDWRSVHIGALDLAYLELNSFQPRLLVGTHENVLASLCPKTGELLWRQVLETKARGDLKLLQVTSASNDVTNTAAARPNSLHGFDMLTIQGHAPALVRGWNANTGSAEWEWSLMPLQPEHAVGAFWFYSNTLLYHILPVWNSHLEVTQYFATTGQTASSTNKINTPWIKNENCVRSGVFYACVEDNQLISIDLSVSKPTVLRKILPVVPKSKLKSLEGVSGALIIDKKLVNIKDDINICTNLESNSFKLGIFNQRRVIAQVDVVNNNLEIKAHYLDSCKPVEEISYVIPYPDNYGIPTLKTFDCKLNRNNDGKGCLFLFATEDESILAVQQGKLRWSREEALANVIATEFIDLPVADTEGTLENEIKGKTGDITTAFVRRISTQIIQIKSILLDVLGLGPPPSDTQKAGLVRDAFGLHKMLVTLTRSGKVFGIDNINGKHHWKLYLNNVQNFNNDQNMRLVVQRTAKHFPYPSLCTVVAKDKETGNGVLLRFNPITGKPSEGGLLRLNYPIKQLSLLAESENDYIKGLLIIDPKFNVHVYPENTKKLAKGLFLFTADTATSMLHGFYCDYEDDKLTTLPIWTVNVGSFSSSNQIIAVALKNPNEHVHSQGRVLGDRSVLYKYINPNLVAVVTQASDPVHKYLLNTFLIDVVSGAIVFSMQHRKARGPLSIVHSENWLAYSYYNDKVRRTEITTIELYEGKTQTNSTVWSSLNAPPLPHVERQSYIIPTIVEAMKETITERGITNKHVLFGTASGAVVELPWALLDPRRPIASTTQGREEGAIPYIPELPLPQENIINYNQTVARIRNIFTAPSGLESTCLVVVTGLDLFVTRVAPSKTFDLLKEDFDYILITTVLVALSVGSLVVKHLASKKLLKQAWK